MTDPNNMVDDGDLEMEEEEEEEEEIEAEQVEEYCCMLDRLGNFPEKVAINSLSMVAEDYASSPKSAEVLYRSVRSRIVDTSSPADRKLPLVYVMDSLLKNVRGSFVSLIEGDAARWMPLVHDALDADGKARLRRVWTSWKDFGAVKDEARWRVIGACFLKAEEQIANRKMAAEAMAKAAGIGKAADGSLQLNPALRRQMQTMLDEMQSTGVDELDKVSLERLYDIKPDLLLEVKKEAEHEMREAAAAGGGVGVAAARGTVPIAASGVAAKTPIASAVVAPLSTDGAGGLPPGGVGSEWSKLKLNHLERAHEVIASLQHHVRAGSGAGVARAEMESTVNLYAALSVSAHHLTGMLSRLKDQDEEKDEYGGGENPGGAGGGRSGTGSRRRFSLVRKERFTTEGIKGRNDAVVAGLYETGLPFVSSADGRRFATQIELSKHLDGLFKRNQIEKTMDRTEERGWYAAESSWIGLQSSADDGDGDGGKETDNAAAAGGGAEDLAAASGPSTVVADESRDRCIVCGINFDMFFDQEDGEWKYRNCREIEVMNDDAAEEESEAVLVHATCLRGLGSPEFLTRDQIIHSP